MTNQAIINEAGIRKRRRFIIRRTMMYVFLTLFTFLMAFPFLWMISSALKTKDEVMNSFSLIPQNLLWSNFAEAFQGAPFGTYIFNSLITACGIVAIQIVNSAMIGYTLTQLNFKGRGVLFAVIMGTNMLPAAATYVPSYIILAKMGLINSYTGLIISNCVYMFGIFLVRQAFLQVNRSLVEASWVEGSSHWHTLWHVLVPITKSSFVTLGLLSFVANYNNYMWPSLITTRPQYYLISQGLRLYFIEGGSYGIKWPQIMAASTFTMLPLMLLFFVTQRWFIQGLSDSGVKG